MLAQASKGVMVEIVSSDDLDAPEIEIFKAVAAWAAVNGTENAKEVIQSVRLPLISPQDLKCIVKNSGRFLLFPALTVLGLVSRSALNEAFAFQAKEHKSFAENVRSTEAKGRAKGKDKDDSTVELSTSTHEDLSKQSEREGMATPIQDPAIQFPIPPAQATKKPVPRQFCPRARKVYWLWDQRLRAATTTSTGLEVEKTKGHTAWASVIGTASNPHSFTV